MWSQFKFSSIDSNSDVTILSISNIRVCSFIGGTGIINSNNTALDIPGIIPFALLRMVEI